ncbi:MAG: ATP-binding protein [Anaerolineae bacterium]|nr:ATP-binding protein [Anaerolineae bacterium]
MKCRKCGAVAVINMRHHRLALCAEHFLDWFVSYTQRTIEEFHMFSSSDRLLVAVSGGKDSLALWDTLARLGYQADGLYIGLGIGGDEGYSAASQGKAQAFADAHGLTLHVVDIKKTYGESIPELARRTGRGRGKPCSVCGLVKRHVMNRVTLEGGYAALATGHNLDDEAAVLLQNTLRWQTGYLARQAPVLEATHPGLARKVKPFCRLYERETAAYALVRGIDYIYDECPHASGATTIFYKELLNRLEGHSPGTRHSFYLDFLRAKKKGQLLLPAEEEPDLHPCQQCGQPTTAPGLCAFCRLWA